LGFTSNYTYDAIGNLTGMTDRNGRVKTYQYDALNRQIGETWLDGNNNPIHQFQSTFDAASQLINTSDTDNNNPNSAYAYQYDAVGNLTSVTSNNLETPSVSFQYKYDAVNHPIQTKEVTNSVTTALTNYTYDELNRVTRMIQMSAVGKRVDLFYNKASQLQVMRRFSGIGTNDPVADTTYRYDAVGRLIDLGHYDGSEALAKYRYSYDAAGRIVRLNSLVDGVSDYIYDAINQITGANHDSQTDESFTYDGNGNRVYGDYVVGGNNRLLSDGIYNYAYDNEGNLITQTEIATGIIEQLSWDYRNRLVGVVTG
jgi:YD repeat-containing protein